jgi:hypothetical protein
LKNYSFYELHGEEYDDVIEYFKISRCTGGCLIDRELVFGRGQKGSFKTQAMVSALFVDSGFADSSGIVAADHCMDNKQIN